MVKTILKESEDKMHKAVEVVRHELVKIVHSRLEETRVAIRNVRRDILKDLKEFEHEKLISEDNLSSAEEDMQKLTDRMIEQVDDIGEHKEKEIMEV